MSVTLPRVWIVVMLAAVAGLAGTVSARTEENIAPPAAEAMVEATSEAQRTAALGALTSWLSADFLEAFPTALAWASDERIPPQTRSAVLRAAYEPARTQTAPDFDERAAIIYEGLIESLPADDERSRLHQASGNLAISRGRFETAETLYRQAMSDEQGRATSERANLRSALGVSLAQQGKLDQALEAMLQSYRLYEQTDDGPSSNLLRNIGGLSIYLEDWEQAIRFSTLAIEKIGTDNPAALGVYSNLAAAQTEQGRLDEALQTLQTAMALSEASGQASSSVVSNMAYVLRELGRPEEALARYRQAAELNRAANDPASLAIAFKNIGETLIALDRRAEGNDYLMQSLASYRDADIKPKRLELYPVLVDNLEQLGRYREALELMREYRALDNELVSAEAQARVAELQNAFDLERRERELADLERERITQQAELLALQSEQARQTLQQRVLTIGLIVLACVLMLTLRLLSQRNRANRLLAVKNAEIEEQRQALTDSNARLHRQSFEDELTGLSNRRAIHDIIENDDGLLQRTTDWLLIMIDLDRFKGINDRFGHPVGDAVLAQVADVLRGVAGPNDLLARWGGEEFLWLIADAGPELAAERCTRLSDALKAERFEIPGRRLSISASMGVASLDLDDAEDPATALALALNVADSALYEAKREGRDRWVGFERRSTDRTLFEGNPEASELIASGSLKRIPREG
jgi:diguanylate cyclase (GGDEF)-like protein